MSRVLRSILARAAFAALVLLGVSSNAAANIPPVAPPAGEITIERGVMQLGAPADGAPADGAPAQAALASPFGLGYPKTRVGGFEFPIRFLSKEERELSAEPCRASGDWPPFVASGIGVFVSADPLGYPDSANGYVWGVGAPWGHDPLGLDGLTVGDYFGIYAQFVANNVASAAGAGRDLVDQASGGQITGAARAVAAVENGEGLAGVARAYVSGRVAVTSGGFSEAKDLAAHAADLVGAGGIKRGSAQIGTGIAEGNVDTTLRGLAEFSGGVGQLAGTAAVAVAPFEAALSKATAVAASETAPAVTPGAATTAGSGPVRFKLPPNATPEQIAQARTYCKMCNEALEAGELSPTGRVSTKGQLRREATRAGAQEKARAAAAGQPYQGHPGHVPDTTWTGKPTPANWLDLDPKVNTSLGGQAPQYPVGYKPTEFTLEER